MFTVADGHSLLFGEEQQMDAGICQSINPEQSSDIIVIHGMPEKMDTQYD